MSRYVTRAQWPAKTSREYEKCFTAGNNQFIEGTVTSIMVVSSRKRKERQKKKIIIKKNRKHQAILAIIKPSKKSALTRNWTRNFLGQTECFRNKNLLKWFYMYTSIHIPCEPESNHYWDCSPTPSHTAIMYVIPATVAESIYNSTLYINALLGIYVWSEVNKMEWNGANVKKCHFKEKKFSTAQITH